MNNPALDVGQPVAATDVQEGQFLVFQAKQVEQRGVEIVDVGTVDEGLVAKLIGRARRPCPP
jgi:hypothetical protein